jgi:sialic acid synthase SpsE
MLARDKVFIIAEAGSNWRCGSYPADIRQAKELIRVAAETEADAVKFQTYRPETVYVPNAGSSDYLAEAGMQDSINDILREHAMPYEMIPELAAYCVEMQIQFMSTPFSVADAEAIDPHVRIHKIASYEISHPRLIEFVAKTGKPLILSTGAATPDDIEWALNYFRVHGGREIALMQCTAKYPAPLSTLNIRVIPELIRDYNTPVGLSDHSRDPVIGPVTAVAMGATIIEKHFTLDNQLPGPDHAFAVTPDELARMVQAIRDTEQALGSSEKTAQPAEEDLRQFGQRAIQAVKEIKAGDTLRLGVNIDILRSGNRQKGLHPRFLPEVEGKAATRGISLGDGVRDGDYA